MDQLLDQATVFKTESVLAAKEKGVPVLGYACVATPVEVMEAAGALPYRIRANSNTETDLADARLSRFNCSFCRSCLQLGLNGTYDFLDGLIETNGCDHLRGMFENWQYEHPAPYFYYVKVPHIVTPESMDYFEEEIGLFRASLEKQFGKTIDDSALWSAIENQQKVQDALSRLYELRCQNSTSISGTDVLALYLLGTTMSSLEFAEKIDSFIAKAKTAPPREHKARVILCGSATDEIEFLAAIEAMGALIVADGLCYGHRAFWPKRGIKDQSPERYLARAYLENLLCPRMFDDYHKRRDYVLQTSKEAKVDGAILVHNKFCDVHGVDNVQLNIDLEQAGIPVLKLEKEYGTKADIGRMKTRVQAFLERIGG